MPARSPLPCSNGGSCEGGGSRGNHGFPRANRVGVAPRQVERPGGTIWVVRCFRFRRPPWRAFAPDLGIADPDEGVLIAIPAIVVYMAFAPFTLLLIRCSSS